MNRLHKTIVSASPTINWLLLYKSKMKQLLSPKCHIPSELLEKSFVYWKINSVLGETKISYNCVSFSCPWQWEVLTLCALVGRELRVKSISLVGLWFIRRWTATMFKFWSKSSARCICMHLLHNTLKCMKGVQYWHFCILFLMIASIEFAFLVACWDIISITIQRPFSVQSVLLEISPGYMFSSHFCCKLFCFAPVYIELHLPLYATSSFGRILLKLFTVSYSR